jgi:signal transduction histidine kinase
VARAVDEALSFVDERLKRQRIRVEVQRRPGLPRVPGNPDEIQQVVLNLVTNAIHAMPDGGRLHVVVERVIRRKEGLALSAPAPYLMLEVSDTGVGVPHGDRERIFEAFFTTKDAGEGTGLGLAVSNGIVKDHDGWIELGDPPRGEGALFRVFLPVSAPADDDDPLSTSPGLPKKAESATIDR